MRHRAPDRSRGWRLPRRTRGEGPRLQPLVAVFLDGRARNDGEGPERAEVEEKRRGILERDLESQSIDHAQPDLIEILENNKLRDLLALLAADVVVRTFQRLRSTGSRTLAAAVLGAEAYESHTDLLEKSGVEAVIICTPPATHTEIYSELLR